MPTELSPTADAVQIAATDAKGIALVDLRLDIERRAAGVVAGATHITMADLDARAGEIEGPVVFFCADGGRSTAAAMRFREAGREAWSLMGGYATWKVDGPTEQAT